MPCQVEHRVSCALFFSIVRSVVTTSSSGSSSLVYGKSTRRKDVSELTLPHLLVCYYYYSCCSLLFSALPHQQPLERSPAESIHHEPKSARRTAACFSRGGYWLEATVQYSTLLVPVLLILLYTRSIGILHQYHTSKHIKDNTYFVCIYQVYYMFGACS